MESLDDKIKRFLSIGSGYGYGDGYGDGSGDGSGSGYGYGDGDFKSYNHHKVYYIDGVATLIDVVRGNVARGSIINSDKTIKPCYIARSGDSFAHGDTAKKAMADAVSKEMQNKPEEERIAEFVKAHPVLDVEFPCEDLFRWHNTLTGSCEFGRRQFCRDMGIDLDGKYTVRYFLEITKEAYGGSIIKKVMEEYE